MLRLLGTMLLVGCWMGAAEARSVVRFSRMAPLSQACGNKSIRSVSSRRPRKTTARFVNNSAFAVDLYWIDFRGNPKKYATIPARRGSKAGVVTQSTYVGHVWMVAMDANGRQCIGVYRAHRTGVVLASVSAAMVGNALHASRYKRRASRASRASRARLRARRRPSRASRASRASRPKKR